jgi:predicted RND superfamily exporter protein
MGYLEIPIDMTTMVIIPILLGLAVDDTIHFITHSKLEFERTRNYRNAIQTTFRTVGKAIFTTSFILIASFSAYMTSVALFFVHLAVLMSVGVLAALLADYFITPILVMWTKPFGSEGDLIQQQTSHSLD